jgi:hypothetical protein
VRWFPLALVVTACGRLGFTSLIDAADAPDLITVTLTAEAGCAANMSNGPRTADALCQQAGYRYALAAHGHYWFQCAGTLERCPGGWQIDGMSCPDWCGAADCAAVPFCGNGNTVYERVGDGATVFDPEDSGPPCAGYNPGWTVRVRCVQ